MSNAININEPEVKVGEVTQAMSNLSHEVDRFDRLSQILFGRLARILKTTDPLAGTEAFGQVGFSTPLAEQIQESVRQLDSASDRLQDIINRIEI